MTTWQLYVDETGNFGELEPVAIAGVLIEGYGSIDLTIALREQLDAIFDGVPYPPHAAFHGRALSLLWSVVHRAPASDRFYGVTQAAKRELDRAPSGPLAELRRELASKSRPDRVPFPLYGRALRALRVIDGHACSALEAEVQRAREGLAQLLSGALSSRTGRRVMLVGAWLGTYDARPTDDVSAWADSRYVRVYEVLVERCLALLGACETSTDLWVHLADRRWASTSRAVLAGAEKRAAEHPLLRSVRTRVTRAQARAYDARVPPGIVLADFAAHTLGSALRTNPSWANLQSSLYDRVGLRGGAPCALLGRELPAVAAEGPAREAIRAASVGEVVALPDAPAWAAEQASLWIDALVAERETRGLA